MKIQEVLGKKVGDVTYNRYILIYLKMLLKKVSYLGKNLKLPRKREILLLRQF